MVKDTQGYRVFRVIKDELPSENSHLTIFMRTLKTRTAEAKQLGEIGTVLVASRVKFRLAYPRQPMVCFQFVEA